MPILTISDELIIPLTKLLSSGGKEYDPGNDQNVFKSRIYNTFAFITIEPLQTICLEKTKTDKGNRKQMTDAATTYK